ncbi:tyrosine-protein phosphatase non-receptor type 22 isoform X2 [Pimephales promelas]|uniref:tyrosine-protein phosphatase non-receptor type 22 isoform X2 n=1 Tax=Pimephales promelas TaxID=90988 RepID=UPI0019557133|nr:tyrosine-protein phosphatase non-receptor type 22 isoform X2 [Pimephales promelas]KAG1961515.1 tyrosine-protein phosphatase non-receptor type [Pimephales promelas]
MDAQACILRDLLAQIGSKEAEQEGAENGFAGEFLKLKRQSTKYRAEKTYPSTAADKQDNVKKNRYKDIVPFDHSRVKLSLIKSKHDTDYINASFIKGVLGPRAYIATQGPLPNTVLDFWRMLWEYNVQVIVMACREFEMGRKKCERYWPESKEHVFACEPFTIHYESDENKGEYLIRTLKVTCKQVSRTLKQLHYVNWPDHGVPDSIPPILELLQDMRIYQDHEELPICIHCSAGCGRTGVLCAIDYTWNLLKRQMIPDNFSIFELVKDMRTQRPSVVQTKEQYELVYRTIKLLFERYLAAMEEPNREVPAPTLPVTISSGSEISDFSDSESETETDFRALRQTEHRRNEMEILMDEHNHITQNITSWPQPHLHPFSQEVISSKVSPADMLSTMSEAQINNQRSFVAPTPQRDVTTCGYERTEPSTSLNTDLTQAACYHPISLVQELRPNMKHLEWEENQDVSPVGTDYKPIPSSTLCFTVEDPYFGPESPPAGENPSVMDSMVNEIWIENPCPIIPSLVLNNPCLTIPSLELNNQVMELPKHNCNETGANIPSSDEDTPPPLPERTPESFILAEEINVSSIPLSPIVITSDSPPPLLYKHPQDISETSELLTLVIPTSSGSESVNKDSPPSPVPPLPERTPESFELAMDKDLVQNVTREMPQDVVMRVGKSLEWSGQTSEAQTDMKRSWSRSKSLKLRMSLPVSSIPLSPIAITSHSPPPLLYTHPQESLLHTLTPHEQTSETFRPVPGTEIVTPPLPERTPESFIFPTEKVSDNNALCLPAEPEQQRQRVGTSSEWSGSSQPRSFLESSWSRSKSVRSKSSKQEPLSVAAPVTPPVSVTMATGGKVEHQTAPSSQPAATGPTDNRTNRGGEKTSLVSKARTKSIKFLKGKQRPKTAPPPIPPPAPPSAPPAAPPQSAPPPPYGAAVGFLFSFGSRFGKPKGPRSKPETWV